MAPQDWIIEDDQAPGAIVHCGIEDGSYLAQIARWGRSKFEPGHAQRSAAQLL
jgi:hypothetical protein